MTEPIRLQRRVTSHADADESDAELRDFMLIVRRALLLIVAYIDKRYVVSKS